MTDYRYPLLRLVGELKDHEAIVVDDCYMGDGLPEEEINELEQEYGIRLTDSVRSFFEQVNGMILEWRLAPEKVEALTYLHEYTDPVYGRVNLMTLQEILPRWMHLRDTVWDEQMEEDARGRLHRFRPFDDNVEEAFVGFLVEEGTLEDRLYYLRQEDEDIVDVDATIYEYFQALRQSRGFYWWQDAFALRPNRFGAREMFAYIPQLFPGERFTTFE